MRLLVTGDLHLSANPRDGYRHIWVQRFIGLAAKRKPDVIVILGDLCEAKDNHPAELVNDVVSYFDELAQIAPVWALQGNHDYVADPGNGYWFFLNHIPNIKWITAPVMLGRSDGLSLLFLPHTRDYKRAWKGLNFAAADWIFAHNSFDGADAGHGHRLGGIPTDIFPPGARVISGDIHVPQTFGPITYVGAPYLCDFGDDYKPRILQIDDDQLTSIPCPGAQKRLIEIRGPEELGLQDHVNAGDIVKVRVRLGEKDRARWPEIQKAVRNWAEEQDVTLHMVQPQFAANTAGRAPLSHTRRSDEEILRGYGKARGLSKAVLEAGLALVQTNKQTNKQTNEK